MWRWAAVLLLAAALVVPAGAAAAAPALEVTPARDLDPDGQQVSVRGSGYDERKGIYVAWCVVPPEGQKPTPCGGGEDRDGSSGSSVWISSFPPAYGVGLAEGYDEGGSFDVEIVVSRFIGEIDCFKVACAVATRNDHERTDDRSQDVFAPVQFRGQERAAADGARRDGDGNDGGDVPPADDARSGAAAPERRDRPAPTTSAPAPEPATAPNAGSPSAATSDGDSASSSSVAAPPALAQAPAVGDAPADPAVAPAAPAATPSAVPTVDATVPDLAVPPATATPAGGGRAGRLAIGGIGILAAVAAVGWGTWFGQRRSAP